MAVDTLTERERQILDLESRWFATAGGKGDAIRGLGLNPTRYYQLLNRLIRTESALTYDAVVVHRLRRIASRSSQRPTE